ncbi:MAG: purine-nucleoside/S-methyl-5-thioadenosine phosphorylase / adenosine deaminase [Acidobacteriota bacterium]|nr:purine-nucleoside/S-methyl-5-thioadenosine phosphorylase / adenosine deaminase [Acidobacteriota bacterium]
MSYWVWRDRRGDVEVRFTGRGPAGEREEILTRIEPGAPPVAWAKQIHSATVLPARAGHCGEGDALFGDTPDLALSVVTADCVPVLLAGPNGLAAVHAGWRGLVGGVIPAALEKLGGAEIAWIGPTIGPCCYEVGEEMAEQFPEETVVPGPKPHLDLVAAARLQLKDVEEIRTVGLCTRCEADKLYSYRREGKGVGRNVAFIWRRPSP